jgi:tetratricopeptide (TPR) repeat protein
MRQLTHWICCIACLLTFCSFTLLAKEPACQRSSAQIKAVIDLARANAMEIKNEYGRPDLLQEVAKAYAQDGDFDDAIAVIRVDSKFMWQAADVLGRNMLRCGQSTAVKTAAHSFEGRTRSLMLQWLAERQAKHDDPGAGETLGLIKDADIRQDAQFNIILIKGRNESPAAAEDRIRKFLESVPSSTTSREDLLSQDMALLYAMRDEPEAAIASLTKIDGRERVYSLYAVLGAVAGEKDSKESEQLSKGALELVHPFLKDPDRAYDLSLVAFAQARAGRFDDAITLAQAIPDEQRRNEALVMIATCLIEAKDETRATTILQSLSSVPPGNQDLEVQRAMAWVRIAMAQANAGHGEAALASLDKIHDKRFDDAVNLQRAYALARTGKLTDAAALATQIPQRFPDDLRGRALRLVAAVNAHQNGAPAVIGWAKQLTSSEDRTSACLGIADGLLGEPNQEIPPYFQD